MRLWTRQKAQPGPPSVARRIINNYNDHTNNHNDNSNSNSASSPSNNSHSNSNSKNNHDTNNNSSINSPPRPCGGAGARKAPREPGACHCTAGDQLSYSQQSETAHDDP